VLVVLIWDYGSNILFIGHWCMDGFHDGEHMLHDWFNYDGCLGMVHVGGHQKR